MPQTKRVALKRAKRLGFPKSSVTKSKRGRYYLSPRGVTTSAGKKAYAAARERGYSKASAARISHFVHKRAKRKQRRKRRK